MIKDVLIHNGLLNIALEPSSVWSGIRRMASWKGEPRFTLRVARHPTATLNPVRLIVALVQQVDSLTQTVRDVSGRELPCQTQRAAAAPLSSGRVLKAMAACGAARWMALTTASNRTSRVVPTVTKAAGTAG